MKPIKFKEATKVLQRPATMTDAECASLHVWSDGKQCVSCWKPSFMERVRILFISGKYPFNRPRFPVRVAISIRKAMDFTKAFIKAVREGAKQADKRKHFVGGLLISFIIGLYNPLLGLFSGVVAAALKEWWDSKGHGTVEFMDFFFSSIGALCALPFTWIIHSLIW